ncbi:3-oxoadipate enol-lactonase [Ottowia thiooxydans]|uniref:3-oxoadipate enol-lactonase n=1 Tax=Ottowia thiooxydans TaxID=219182 RepID=A0ABV2Q6L0_9BURK
MTIEQHASPFFLPTVRGQFRVAINGDASLPTLILSNSLGTTLEMWEAQAATFAENYRVVRYNTRGHGGSPVTPGPYNVDDLGADVLAILDALDIEKASFCGISMGGHTGLWLGVHAGHRFDAIAVCNSAAKIGIAQGWSERAATVRANGAGAMQTLADSAPGRWFTEEFIRSHPEVVRLAQGWLGGIAPEGYAACCEALALSDLRGSIGRIATPTLLLAGASDPVTTVADAEAMCAVISGSKLAVVPASHLSNLEAPQAFEHALATFLAESVPSI